jgi:hypothetical protein
LVLLLSGLSKGRRATAQQSALIRQLCRQQRTTRQQAANYRAKYRAGENSKRNKSNIDLIIEAAAKFLKGTAVDFFAYRLKCASRRSAGKRWTAEDKLLALSIFHQPPAA